jgi:hypothetical protein
LIDFRYHVVSIIAVFLALSVGLVLGASFLKEAAVSGLDTQVQDLARNNEGLRRELDRANSGQKYLNGVVSSMVEPAVAGRLKGHKAVVVSLPGADTKMTDGLVKLLGTAGATVTGQVSIKGAWTDPKREADLVTALGPTGAAATSGSATDRAAKVLASAVTERQPPTGAGSVAGTPSAPPSTVPPSTSPPTTTLPSAPGTGESPGAPPVHNPQLAGEALTRFKDAGFIDVKDTPANGADLVVIVAPAAATGGDDPGRTNSSYLSLARALDTGDDGTVMAGNAAAAQENGAIWALRRNDQTAKSVSTVDTAETPAGQVAVVWALVVEEKQGGSGQYGVTGTTDGPLPTLPKETP